MLENNNAKINIWMFRRNETISYAAEELLKYLKIMSGNNNSAVVVKKYINNAEGLKLGLLADFGVEVASVQNSENDDAIYVDVRNSKGIIAGSNPRSVLFAVYRFLEANGCKWIRPGKDGDIVPRREISNLEANISEKAFSRFRGNNNCGSHSFEHILEKIEWAPKVGLNTFLTEFFIPRDLLNEWYNHEYYSLKEPEHRSDIELAAYCNEVTRSIKKRGLIYQKVGHGWTGAFFNFSEVESSMHDGLAKIKNGSYFNEKISEEDRKYIALVDGKREISISGLLLTELCYSNPEVRERLAKCIADYAEEHPEVDMLHFWLSDAMNVHCECELCIDTRPSDFYVMILNGIDEELTVRGLKTRVVFLIYQDLLWAPEKEKIKNPERFVMMFAPISRNYSEPYTYEGDASQLGEFKYNKNPYPSEISAYIASLKDWQKVFKGEAFSFDYHMTWYHYFDQGYFGFAKVMAEDIKRLPALGLSGFVSCQNMRTSFPTGFPLHVHAKYLWNPEEDFDKLAISYFEAAFGSDGGICMEYMKQLSDLFVPGYFYKNPDIINTKSTLNKDHDFSIINKLSKVPEIIEKFRPVIERNIRCDEPAHSASWKYLFIHMELALSLANALRAKEEGRHEIANAYWTIVVEYVMVNEDRLKSIFDPFWFFMSFQRRKKLFEGGDVLWLPDRK